MSHDSEMDTHPTFSHQETCTHPQTNMPRQHLHQIPSDFNYSVIELFRHQTELAHSTQCLHQQTTDALHNITKSSSLQENLYFINDIPVFKAKDPQSFDEWLDQIDKVTSLTNKDPYKLALAKSQGSSSKTISSYPPTFG